MNMMINNPYTILINEITMTMMLIVKIKNKNKKEKEKMRMIKEKLGIPEELLDDVD